MPANPMKEKALPKSRLGRFGRFARMAGGIAAGAVGEGVKQLSQGNRPALSDMMLTPANVKRLTKQLADMRGAAMKVGQLLSMETQDFLPPELAAILAQLRNQAFTMPRAELEQTLDENWGPGWAQQFKEFDWNPIAAASIGQVHQAVAMDGRRMAIKVQYQGVKDSINSDVDNIATLLKVTRLLPEQVEIDGILADAKQQLHEEADYLLEAQHMHRFKELLADNEAFKVPEVFDDLTTSSILCMEFCDGIPIEEIEDFDASKADDVCRQLFELLFLELYAQRLMQTDANFANYLFDPADDKIVLLDFGATRSFTKSFAIDYKRLMRAVQNDDEHAIIDAADRLGYGAHAASSAYQQFVVGIFRVALEPIAKEGLYDFGSAQITKRLADTSDQGMRFREYWQTPPSDILYLHRKIGGLFLLASRLNARVNVHQIAKPYLKRLAL